MLGHASLRTTQRYAHVDIDHLMAVSRQGASASEGVMSAGRFDRRPCWPSAATGTS
jgi:hypothetical protein